MRDAYICDAVRTPIGRYGGALAAVRADDLAAVPLSALLERHPQVDWAAVDDVILGCANQAGEDNRNVARMALLLAGLPESVPGVTVNRLCASGLEATCLAARAVAAGDADLVLAGGVESMSRAPFVLAKAEAPFSRSLECFDTTMGWRFVNRRLHERVGTDAMGETAETLARELGISREDQDRFALRSHAKAVAAQDGNRFAAEIVPVAVERLKAGPSVVDRDEQPRATTIEQLAALRPAFRADGTVTAGNASSLNDGAAAVLIASEAAAVRHGLRPRARVLGSKAVALAPRVMGLGPVAATRSLLARLGLSLADMAVIELNEAFAVQALACLRQLGLADDDPRVNPLGGAIALGHPLGMSGARLVTTAVQQLEGAGSGRALCTMCVGVGQGLAAVIEAC